MKVTLTPEWERFVAERVRSGADQTPEDVVRRALHLLREHDLTVEANAGPLRDAVASGIAQLDRGEYREFDRQGLQNLAAEIRSNGRRRLAGGSG